MFNHHADSNCIKYIPEKCERDEKKNSEMRCTKYIKKGKALTLHYLDQERLVILLVDGTYGTSIALILETI